MADSKKSSSVQARVQELLNRSKAGRATAQNGTEDRLEASSRSRPPSANYGSVSKLLEPHQAGRKSTSAVSIGSSSDQQEVDVAPEVRDVITDVYNRNRGSYERPAKGASVSRSEDGPPPHVLAVKQTLVNLTTFLASVQESCNARPGAAVKSGLVKLVECGQKGSKQSEVQAASGVVLGSVRDLKGGSMPGPDVQAALVELLSTVKQMAGSKKAPSILVQDAYDQLAKNHPFVPKASAAAEKPPRPRPSSVRITAVEKAGPTFDNVAPEVKETLEEVAHKVKGTMQSLLRPSSSTPDEDEVAQLKRQVKELQRELTAKDQELRTQRAQVGGQTDSLKKQLARYEAEADEYRSQIKALKNEVKFSQEKAVGANQADALRKELARYEDEVDGYRKEIRCLKDEIKSLHEEFEDSRTSQMTSFEKELENEKLRVLNTLRHRGLARAWRKWSEKVHLKRRQRTMMKKVGCRIKSTGLTIALFKWRSVIRARQLKNARAQIHKVEEEMEQTVVELKVAMGESATEYQALVEAAGQRAREKVIDLWRNRPLARALRKWSERVMKKRQEKKVLRKASRRIRMSAQFAALNQWKSCTKNIQLITNRRIHAAQMNQFERELNARNHDMVEMEKMHHQHLKERILEEKLRVLSLMENIHSARAFRKWSEGVVSRRWQRRVLTQVITRMTKHAITKAWGKWVSVARIYRDRRSIRESRAELMAVRDDMARIMEEHSEQISAYKAAVEAAANHERSRIISTWMNRSVARGLRKWSEGIMEQRRQRRIMEKTIKRISHARIGQAFLKWVSETRQLQVMRLVREKNEEARRLRDEMSRLMEEQGETATAYQAALQTAVQHEKERILSTWMNRGPARAIHKWKEGIMKKREQKRRMAGVVRKLLCWKQSLVIERWKANTKALLIRRLVRDRVNESRQLEDEMARLMEEHDRERSAIQVAMEASALEEKERIIQQFTHTDEARAFRKWSEGVIRKRRQKALMRKVAARISSNRSYTAFNTWRHLSWKWRHRREIEEQRHQKQELQTKLERMMEEAGETADAYKLAMEIAVQNEKERIMATWMNRGVARALRKWSEGVKEKRRRRGVMRKVVLKMTQHAMDSAMTKWKVETRALQTKKIVRDRDEEVKRLNEEIARIMEEQGDTANAYQAAMAAALENEKQRVIMTWMNRGLSRALIKWRSKMKERQRQRDLMKKIAARISHQGVFMALNKWRIVTKVVGFHRSEQERLSEIEGYTKEIARLQELAFQASAQHEEELMTALHNEKLRVIASWMQRGPARAFHTWSANIKERKRLQKRVAKTMLRMRLAKCYAALSKWQRHSEAFRIRQKKGEMDVEMARNRDELARMKAAAEDQQTSHEKMMAEAIRSEKERIIQRWKHRPVLRALQTWIAEVKEKKRRRQLLARAALKILQSKVYGAFNKWRDFSVSYRTRRQEDVHRQMETELERMIQEHHDQLMAAEVERADAVLRAKEHIVYTWRNREVARAVHKWQENVMAERNRRQILEKVSLRILNSKLFSAFNQWKSGTESLRSDRNLRSKEEEITILQRQIDELQSGMSSQMSEFQLSMAAAVSQEKLRIINTWKSRGLARAMNEWTAGVKKQRKDRMLLGKVVQRITNMRAARCFNTWANNCTSLRKLREEMERKAEIDAVRAQLSDQEVALAKQLLDQKNEFEARMLKQKERVLVAWKNRPVKRSWLTWSENVVEKRRRRGILAKVSARMMHSHLFAAFRTWTLRTSKLKTKHNESALVEEIERLQEEVDTMKQIIRTVEGNAMLEKQVALEQSRERVILSWQNRPLSMAIRKWSENIMRRRARDVVLGKVLARMGSLQEIRVLNTWKDQAQAQAKRRRFLMRFAMHWRQQRAAAVFAQWSGVIQDARGEQVRKTQLLAKVSHRLQNMKVTRALNTWIDFVRKLNRHRAILRNVSDRWKNRSLLMAWNTWQFIARSRGYGRVVMGSMLRRWRQRELSAAINTWKVVIKYVVGGERLKEGMLSQAAEADGWKNEAEMWRLEAESLKEEVDLMARQHVDALEEKRMELLNSAANRWKNQALFRCLKRWQDCLSGKVGKDVRMRKALVHMMNLKLTMAFASWQENTVEMMKKKLLLRRHVQRWTHANQFQAWSTWVDKAVHKRVVTLAAQRVLVRWKNRRSKMAIDALRDNARGRRRGHTVVTGILGRISYRRMGKTFLQWRHIATSRALSTSLKNTNEELRSVKASFSNTSKDAQELSDELESARDRLALTEAKLQDTSTSLMASVNELQSKVNMAEADAAQRDEIDTQFKDQKAKSRIEWARKWRAMASWKENIAASQEVNHVVKKAKAFIDRRVRRRAALLAWRFVTSERRRIDNCIRKVVLTRRRMRFEWSIKQWHQVCVKGKVQIRLSGMQSELQSASVELANLQNGLDTKEKNIDNIASRVRELEEERDDLVKQLDDAVAKSVALENDIDRMKSDMNHQSKQHDGLRSEIVSLKEEIAALNQSLDDARDQVQEAQNGIVDVSNAKSDTEAILSEKQAMTDRLTEEISNLKAKIESLQSENKDLRADAEQIQNRLQSNNEELEGKLRESDEKIQGAAKNYENLKNLQFTQLILRAAQNRQATSIRKALSKWKLITVGKKMGYHEMVKMWRERLYENNQRKLFVYLKARAQRQRQRRLRKKQAQKVLMITTGRMALHHMKAVAKRMKQTRADLQKMKNRVSKSSVSRAFHQWKFISKKTKNSREIVDLNCKLSEASSELEASKTYEHELRELQEVHHRETSLYSVLLTNVNSTYIELSFQVWRNNTIAAKVSKTLNEKAQQGLTTSERLEKDLQQSLETGESLERELAEKEGAWEHERNELKAAMEEMEDRIRMQEEREKQVVEQVRTEITEGADKEIAALKRELDETKQELTARDHEYALSKSELSHSVETYGQKLSDLESQVNLSEEKMEMKSYNVWVRLNWLSTFRFWARSVDEKRREENLLVKAKQWYSRYALRNAVTDWRMGVHRQKLAEHHIANYQVEKYRNELEEKDQALVRRDEDNVRAEQEFIDQIDQLSSRIAELEGKLEEAGLKMLEEKRKDVERFALRLMQKQIWSAWLQWADAVETSAIASSRLAKMDMRSSQTMCRRAWNTWVDVVYHEKNFRKTRHTVSNISVMRYFMTWQARVGESRLRVLLQERQVDKIDQIEMHRAYVEWKNFVETKKLAGLYERVVECVEQTKAAETEAEEWKEKADMALKMLENGQLPEDVVFWRSRTKHYFQCWQEDVAVKKRTKDVFRHTAVWWAKRNTARAWLKWTAVVANKALEAEMWGMVMRMRAGVLFRRWHKNVLLKSTVRLEESLFDRMNLMNAITQFKRNVEVSHVRRAAEAEVEKTKAAFKGLESKIEDTAAHALNQMSEAQELKAELETKQSELETKQLEMDEFKESRRFDQEELISRAQNRWHHHREAAAFNGWHHNALMAKLWKAKVDLIIKIMRKNAVSNAFESWFSVVSVSILVQRKHRLMVQKYRLSYWVRVTRTRNLIRHAFDRFMARGDMVSVRSSFGKWRTTTVKLSAATKELALNNDLKLQMTEADCLRSEIAVAREEVQEMQHAMQAVESEQGESVKVLIDKVEALETELVDTEDRREINVSRLCDRMLMRSAWLAYVKHVDVQIRMARVLRKCAAHFELRAGRRGWAALSYNWRTARRWRAISSHADDRLALRAKRDSLMKLRLGTVKTASFSLLTRKLSLIVDRNSKLRALRHMERFKKSRRDFRLRYDIISRKTDRSNTFRYFRTWVSYIGQLKVKRYNNSAFNLRKLV